MRVVSKFLILTLLLLIIVQLNAFTVPSYSYGNMKGNSFRMGLGFLSAVKPMDKLDKFSFYQPYVQFGLAQGFSVGFDFQYRADVILYDMDHALSASNILTLDIVKSIPEINSSFSIGYGYGVASHQHLIAALILDIGPFNSASGMNIYNTNDMSIVNGIFTKISMPSKSDIFNVNPYVFFQFEAWDLNGDDLSIPGDGRRKS